MSGPQDGTILSQMGCSEQVVDSNDGEKRRHNKPNHGMPAAPLLRSRRARWWPAVLGLGYLLLATAPSSALVRASAPNIWQWAPTGSMASARAIPTATLLRDGEVLVAGGCTNGSNLASAELYHPRTGTWTTTGSMTADRCGHTATLLQNGQVLVAGGYDSNDNFLASAELYNPATGTWTATGNMSYYRLGHTATLLPNGQVLVTGGACHPCDTVAALNSTELYNPNTGTWTLTGTMTIGREWPTATLLATGQVLVAGGLSTCTPSDCNPVASAELYDPHSGTWTPTGSLPAGLYDQTAVLLRTGKVLVAGGSNTSCDNGCPPTASAELYNPGTGMWTATGNMTTPRISHTETLLPDGKVLVIGGSAASGTTLGSTEQYDPRSGTWTLQASMITARAQHTATLLYNCRILVAGGCSLSSYACGATYYSSAEIGR